MDRVGELEKKYVLDVLSSQFKSSSGATYMRRLEEAFAERFGVSYAISCVNGTATMHAALEAMGIGEGDEVIVPPLTMSATTFAVLQANATPIFADVDPETFQICASSIEHVITPYTKAVIPVSLYGLAPDFDLIKKVTEPRGIKIIEDNAECFLGEYKGNLVGTLGDCASFSFQSSKHLTSGEGGIVITDDEELALNIRRVTSLGYAGVGAAKAKISKADIQLPEYSRHVSMGWNYRMPELCCAAALAQVERIDALVEQRIQSADIFADYTRDFQSWFKPQLVPAGYKNSYWTWVCRNLNEDLDWKTIRDDFARRGGHGVYGAWKLTYLEPMFENMSLLGRERYLASEQKLLYRPGLCPTAEAIQPQLFQFKTNYWNLQEARDQADILANTLKGLS